MIQANRLFRRKTRLNPTRVATDELQLHDLQKAEAALDVQKKARPDRQDMLSGQERSAAFPREQQVDGGHLRQCPGQSADGPEQRERQQRTHLGGDPRAVLRS